jgi:hypothetical protein
MIMKKINLIFKLAIITICVILFYSCHKEKVTDITLNKSELMLIPGETETLTATLHPADATNKTVTWTSSNPEIATVSENGLITAITNGSTNIIVTTKDGKKTATCLVTVDYRAQWIGNWEFEIIRCAWHGEIGVWNDTLNYFGKIDYGNIDNVLIIDYIDNISLTMEVVESGKLIGISQNSHETSSGGFEGKEKVKIVSSGGGNGGGSTDTINGTKRTKGVKE